MAQINPTVINQRVVAILATDKRLEGLAYGAAKGRVTFFKNKLIKDFNEHNVTKEIRAGPGLPNSSFLPFGNLFSFIGFYANELDDPLLKIQKLFEDTIRVLPQPRRKRIGRVLVETEFAVESPLLSEVWAITTYPKGMGNVDRSGSWAEDIESRGIDGFAFYVFSYAMSETFSRSTTGIQKKFPVRSGSFNKKIPYIEKLLKNFIKSL